jgi:peptide/nickel transport system permease protein
MNVHYFITRLTRAVFTVLSVTVLLFFLFHTFGPDPAEIMAGPKASPEIIQNIRVQHGLDRPMWTQFVDHLRSMLTLDLGNSMVNHEPILTLLKERAGPSLSLTLPAFILSFILSLFFGFAAAYYSNRTFDRWILLICVLTMSVSSLVYIIFGQYFLAYQWNLFEIAGYDSTLTGRWSFLALPIVLYVVMSIGPEVRIYRSIVLEQIRQDYVQVARSKGVSEFKIMSKHLLKNVMIPIITILVIQLPFLILGSLLLERFFGIPGLGDFLLNSIMQGDFPVVKSMVFFIAVILEGVNIVSDILYTWLDPRVKLSQIAEGVA